MKQPIIAPSVLSADFYDMKSGIARIQESTAEWIHLDVMDGRFVPTITFGAKMVADLRSKTALVLDAHLMTVEPERHVQSLIDAGADFITFHAEACVHSHLLAQKIRAAGRMAGISIVPATPVAQIAELLETVDLVLVMTVNPGAGGQSLIPSCLEKVKRLVEIRAERGLSYLVSIDGGVNSSTMGRIAEAGPDVLVMGSAFFASTDPRSEVEAARAAFSHR